MVNALVTLVMIALFFLSGRIYESIKRLLMLIVDIFLKILNLFGIQIDRKERRLRVPKEFRNTFKDIRVVKISKENNKLKPSINIVALVALILSLTLIIVNLNAVSGGIVTKYLYSLSWVQAIIPSEQSVDVTLTAVAFSCLSFAISKLISQWNETRKYRKAKKEMHLRNKVLHNMSSKDLLTAAKMKDEENLSQVMKPKDTNANNSKEG